MVEAKINKSYFNRIFVFCNTVGILLFALSLFLTIISKPEDKPEAVVYLVLTFICLIVIIFSSIILNNSCKNNGTVFSDSGITQKVKINIGSIVLIERVRSSSLWEQIFKVDYSGGSFFFMRKWERPVVDFLLHFTRYHKIALPSWMTNKKEALEFALTKLPQTCEITDRARIALETRYDIAVRENV
jgi:hypothetical protein